MGVRYLDAGAAAARAVGRVNIRDDRGRPAGFGTGSLVSPVLLLTNHHVLPDAATARTSVIEFNYQDGVDGRPGEDVYRDNDLDRGHLVRRLDPAWGDTDVQAKVANDDTFHFTNDTPQHHAFNAGQTLWLGLEDYVLDNADNHDLAVSVFTGPVLAPDDDVYRGVQLPRQFWKIVAMATGSGDLSVTGYLLSQSALIDDLPTEEAFPYGRTAPSRCPYGALPTSRDWALAPYIQAESPRTAGDGAAAPRGHPPRGPRTLTRFIGADGRRGRWGWIRPPRAPSPARQPASSLGRPAPVKTTLSKGDLDCVCPARP